MAQTKHDASRAAAHAAILKAHAESRIVFFTDPKVLARPGSPLYSPLEVFVPPLVLLASSLTLLFAYGLVEWIVALVMVLLYQVYGAPRLVHWRVHRRAVAALLRGPLSCQGLWEFGGVAIAIRKRPERNCIAPAGNWPAFAAEHLVQSEPTAAADSTG